MTDEELAVECHRVIANRLTQVLLVVPGPPPRGELIRIDRTSRRKCPMGRPANWQDDPSRTVAYFDALEILTWLRATGQIEREVTP